MLTAALTEQVGEDPARSVTRATPAGRRWRLTGEKTTLAAGPAADLFLVPAGTGDGVAVFLVTPRDCGVSVRRQEIVTERALELTARYAT